jgi:hypothetical protein
MRQVHLKRLMGRGREEGEGDRERVEEEHKERVK